MNTYGPTVQGCKFTNVTLEGDQRAFVPSCSFMENSVIAAASRSTFQYIALLSGPSYRARPVPVSWSSFGVAAASVTDVSGKTFISSIEVEFNMASGRATASLLNGVVVTTDKQAVGLRDAMLGQ